MLSIVTGEKITEIVKRRNTVDELNNMVLEIWKELEGRFSANGLQFSIEIIYNNVVSSSSELFASKLISKPINLKA